jgi:aminopeptidase N
MKIAFFTATGEVVEQEILVKNQAQTKITYDGSRGYKAVLLNYGDYSFVKVLLDDASADFFRQNLHNIKDTLTR